MTPKPLPPEQIRPPSTSIGRGGSDRHAGMNEPPGVAKRVLLLSITRDDIQRAADAAGIDYSTLLAALKALDQLKPEGDS